MAGFFKFKPQRIYNNLCRLKDYGKRMKQRKELRKKGAKKGIEK
jgi:hypothetical protein